MGDAVALNALGIFGQEGRVNVQGMPRGGSQGQEKFNPVLLLLKPLTPSNMSLQKSPAVMIHHTCSSDSEPYVLNNHRHSKCVFGNLRISNQLPHELPFLRSHAPIDPKFAVTSRTGPPPVENVQEQRLDVGLKSITAYSGTDTDALRHQRAPLYAGGSRQDPWTT